MTCGFSSITINPRSCRASPTRGNGSIQFLLRKPPVAFRSAKAAINPRYFRGAKGDNLANRLSSHTLRNRHYSSSPFGGAAAGAIAWGDGFGRDLAGAGSLGFGLAGFGGVAGR